MQLQGQNEYLKIPGQHVPFGDKAGWLNSSRIRTLSEMPWLLTEDTAAGFSDHQPYQQHSSKRWRFARDTSPSSTSNRSNGQISPHDARAHDSDQRTEHGTWDCLSASLSPTLLIKPKMGTFKKGTATWWFQGLRNHATCANTRGKRRTYFTHVKR